MTQSQINAGYRFQMFMDERGLTLAQVGDCLGVTPQSVGKWVRGVAPIPARAMDTLYHEYGFNPTHYITGVGEIVIGSGKECPVLSRCREDAHFADLIGRMAKYTQGELMQLERTLGAFIRTVMEASIREQTKLMQHMPLPIRKKRPEGRSPQTA